MSSTNTRSSFTASAGRRTKSRSCRWVSARSMAVPGGVRQRLSRLEIEVVGSKAPRRPPFGERSRRHPVDRRERRPALVPRQLAHQAMLREFGEGDRNDRDGHYPGTEAVQRGERALELAALVPSRDEDALRAECEPPPRGP